ncbi:hypothetical protein [Nocardia rhamnosiphila]
MGKSGFKINKQGIRNMAREIEREFAKNPIRVPVETEYDGAYPAGGSVTNYHGPVVTVTGDNAQIAWDNNTVNQGQNRSERIAPGYEQLAATLAELLAGLPSLPLDDDDEAEVRTNVDTVLAEVVEEEPNQGRIKRGLTMIKGLLSPIATSAIEAASEESAEIARTVIQDLGSSLPF